MIEKYLKLAIMLVFAVLPFQAFTTEVCEQIKEVHFSKRFHLKSLKDFPEEFNKLDLDPEETMVGWDYDNTIATSRQIILDSERYRDLEDKFIQAAAMMRISNEKFYNNIKQKQSIVTREYDFVEEEALLDVYFHLKALSIPQFICTGLPPEQSKVKLLTSKGIDFSYGFKEQISTARSFYKGAFGFLLAQGESKSKILYDFIVGVNHDRLQNHLKPIKNFLFIDNFEGVMKDIEMLGTSQLNAYGFHYTYWADNLTVPMIAESYQEFYPKVKRSERRLKRSTEGDSSASPSGKRKLFEGEEQENKPVLNTVIAEKG